MGVQAQGEEQPTAKRRKGEAKPQSLTYAGRVCSCSRKNQMLLLPGATVVGTFLETWLAVRLGQPLVLDLVILGVGQQLLRTAAAERQLSCPTGSSLLSLKPGL